LHISIKVEKTNIITNQRWDGT